MPKTPVKAEVNNFIGGLVTEASELAFPPNASPDIVNYEHNKDGSVQRRLGLDYEPSFLLFDPPVAANAVTPPNPVVFRWTNAAGIADFSILTLQFDNSLMFFNMDITPISREGLLGEVTFTDFPKDVRYSLAAVDGRLVVVAGVERVAVVTYSAGAFSINYGKLRTRDLWGLECQGTPGTQYENDPLFRASLAPAEHYYNLQNQSWGTVRTDHLTGTSTEPIQNYFFNLGNLFPSNSEQVWAGMQYKPDANGNPSERYYPDMSRDLFGTTSSAAKGFFIIDVISRGASRYTAVQENNARNGGIYIAYELPNRPDYTDGGATCLAEFAGRVFYGGFSGNTVGGDARSPTLSNYVFFSQLVKGSNNIFKCYQEGDPTSRDSNDIVDTDGGFIRISGAEQILGMVPIGSSLIVICSNGVWSITGGADYGFSATNYKVDHISSFGCVAPTSIVVEKGKVYFWGEDGIFVVAKSQLGDTEVASVTKGVIDRYYQSLPLSSRTTVVGVHDAFSGRIRWLYDTEDGGTQELVLDTLLKCIYPFKIYYPDPSIRVVGTFVTTPFTRVSSVDDVFSGVDQVLSSTDAVVVDSEEVSSSLASVKYLIKVGNKYTFGYYRNTSFRDFESFDTIGSDARAHAVTGAVTANDSSIRKQIQFLTLHFRQTAFVSPTSGILENETSCLSMTKWDWSKTALANKWSALKQVFRNPKPSEVVNFDIVSTRNMIRGQGRALAIYFETEPYKDCHIIGWSLAIDGNSKI